MSALAAVAGCALVGFAISVGAQGSGPRGSGASLPAAVYAGWAAAYQKDTGKSIQYTPTGSGAGLKALSEKTIHFAGSEIALSAAELERQKLVQIPVVISGIVPVVNLPGVRANELTLDGKTLAAIYMGKIKRWDNAEIRALNPTLTLPRTEITAVAREESSGSTLVFSQYLANSSPEWKTQLGESSSVKWLEGTLTGRGTDGVAGVVQKISGSIGYVSSNEVVRRKLTSVRLMNPVGDAVTASPASLRAAVIQSPSYTDINDMSAIVNMRAPNAWPIVAVSYALFERTPAATAEVREALKFFYWIFERGDRLASDTGFLPLPSNMQARVIGRFRQITDAKGQALSVMS